MCDHYWKQNFIEIPFIDWVKSETVKMNALDLYIGRFVLQMNDGRSRGNRMRSPVPRFFVRDGKTFIQLSLPAHSLDTARVWEESVEETGGTKNESKYVNQILRNKLWQTLEKALPLDTVRRAYNAPKIPAMEETAETAEDDWETYLDSDDQALLNRARGAAKGEAMDNASDESWPLTGCLYVAQHEYDEIHYRLFQKAIAMKKAQSPI